MPLNNRLKIGEGKLSWFIEGDTLVVNNHDKYNVPIGWSTAVTGRKATFESAIANFVWEK